MNEQPDDFSVDFSVSVIDFNSEGIDISSALARYPQMDKKTKVRILEGLSEWIGSEYERLGF